MRIIERGYQRPEIIVVAPGELSEADCAKLEASGSVVVVEQRRTVHGPGIENTWEAHVRRIENTWEAHVRRIEGAIYRKVASMATEKARKGSLVELAAPFASANALADFAHELHRLADDPQ